MKRYFLKLFKKYEKMNQTNRLINKVSNLNKIQMNSMAVKYKLI